MAEGWFESPEIRADLPLFVGISSLPDSGDGSMGAWQPLSTAPARR